MGVRIFGANQISKTYLTIILLFITFSLFFVFLKSSSPTAHLVSSRSGSDQASDILKEQVPSVKTTTPVITGGEGSSVGGETSSSSLESQPAQDLSEKIHDDVEQAVKLISASDPNQKIQLILSAQNSEETKKLSDAVIAIGGEVQSQLSNGNLVVAFVPANQVYGLATENYVSTIYPNREVEALLDYTKNQIGAPSAWDLGYDGKGIKIAILDSGINTEHEMLKGKVVTEKSFVGSDTADRFGHGTYVAGIAAGAKSSDGKYSGIASGAEILNVKVLL